MINRKTALKMRQKGITLQVIGDRFGVTRERIRQVLGNTRPMIMALKEIKRSKIREKALKLRKRKMTLVEIAQKLKMTPQRLTYAVGALGPKNPVREGYRRCYGYCKKELPISNFSAKGRRCRPCIRKYMFNRYHRLHE